MTPEEGLQVVKTLGAFFGGIPQPKWNDPDVIHVWRQTLAPYSLADALVALNDLRERCQVKLDKGEAVYFPSPIEFGAFVRTVAIKHERQDYERHALDAAVRCDGTRWIENEPNAAGVRPFPSLGSGVVPCPTCSPAQHAKALGGDIHSRMETKGEQPSPPPCRRATSIEELPVSAERAREYIAECKAIVAAWSNQSPLKQALERGWQ